VTRAYVPEGGDLIWLDSLLPAGREPAHRRPALVLSPGAYNRKAKRAIVCAVSRKSTGYPFEVSLPVTSPVSGVVLADHLRNLDWQALRAEKAGRVSRHTLAEIRERIAPLLVPAAY
jgi:mRNA interferase MazF